ncbi:MAG: hypothetical protein ACXADX_11205 [Candidatus Hodarchaeales archaeon]|jgi:hypothetical protein
MCHSQSPNSLPKGPKLRPSDALHEIELRLSCQCGNVLWIPFTTLENSSRDSKEVNPTCQCGETFNVEILRQAEEQKSDSQVRLSIKIMGKKEKP